MERSEEEGWREGQGGAGRGTGRIEREILTII